MSLYPITISMSSIIYIFFIFFWYRKGTSYPLFIFFCFFLAIQGMPHPRRPLADRAGEYLSLGLLTENSGTGENAKLRSTALLFNFFCKDNVHNRQRRHKAYNANFLPCLYLPNIRLFLNKEHYTPAARGANPARS